MDVARAASIFLPYVLSNMIVRNSTARIRPYRKDIAAFPFIRVYTSGTAGFSSENARYGSRFLDRSHPIEHGRFRPKGSRPCQRVIRRFRIPAVADASSIRSFFELLQNLAKERLKNSILALPGAFNGMLLRSAAGRRVPPSAPRPHIS